MNSDNININIVKIGENKARCLIEIKNNKGIKRYIRNIKYNLLNDIDEQLYSILHKLKI